MSSLPEQLLGRMLSSNSMEQIATGWASWLWRIQLGALGTGSRIRRHVVIRSPRSVCIGEFASVGEFVHIWGAGRVTIGNRVLIASHVAITSQTHRLEMTRHHENVLNPVVIEDDVWIGAHAVILPGVTIGHGAVVGAGAVVRHDVPPQSIAVGVPAHIARTIE